MSTKSKKHEKEIARGKYLCLLERDGYELVERVHDTKVSVILPITDEGKVVLVEQYRIPVQSRVMELPAGLVDPGESTDAAAKRELLEETGYDSGELVKLAFWPTSSGMSGEKVTIYLAQALKKIGPGGGVDEGENITIHEVSLNALHKWLKKAEDNGFLVDPKIYAAVYLYQNR